MPTLHLTYDELDALEGGLFFLTNCVACLEDYFVCVLPREMENDSFADPGQLAEERSIARERLLSHIYRKVQSARYQKGD